MTPSLTLHRRAFSVFKIAATQDVFCSVSHTRTHSADIHPIVVHRNDAYYLGHAKPLYDDDDDQDKRNLTLKGK